MTKKQQRKIRRARRCLIFYGSRILALTVLLCVICGVASAMRGCRKTDAETEENPINTQGEAVFEDNSEKEPEKEVRNTQKADEYSMDWDSEESYLLAKIAMAEAESESLEGKAMVIRVVLNRVWSPEFPNTIKEVVYQEGQFAPVSEDDWEETTPNHDCWEALELVQMGNWDESEGATYFEATWNENDWHKKNLELIKTVGNHNFYKEKSGD